MDKNPIRYLNAAGQFSYNTTSVFGDLKPGDLLFFDYDGTGIDHVAMYLGGDDANRDVIEAPGGLQCDLPVRLSSKAILASSPGFVGFRRVVDPVTGVVIATRSPVTLAVTDPDGLTIDVNTVIFTEREILREVPDALYYVVDTNGDDTVIAPYLKSGAYLIRVFPKPGSQATDLYSIFVEAAGNKLTVAENVPLSALPPLGYGLRSSGGTITAFTPIGIDVKPGSSENAVSLRSRAKIPVAILSRADFDAPSVVDVSSLRFGAIGDELSLSFCNRGGEDVNGDGFLDLICHFDARVAGFRAGDTQGILEGRTHDGSLLRGTDAVRIVP